MMNLTSIRLELGGICRRGLPSHSIAIKQTAKILLGGVVGAGKKETPNGVAKS